MKRKKLIISGILILCLFCTSSLSLVCSDTAFASEILPQSENENEKLELNDVADKIYEYVQSDLVPIISGLITAITAILAMLVPYIKTLGKLKSTQSAYACVFDENESLRKLASEKSIDGISQKITEEVASNMEERLSKYEELLSTLLKESEESACRLTSLIDGAKIAWKEADGVDVILSSAPTAAALKKNAIKVELLKSYVAKTLGVKRDEIDQMIDEELENVK